MLTDFYWVFTDFLRLFSASFLRHIRPLCTKMQRRKLTDFRGIFRGFRGIFRGFQGNFEMIFRWFSHPDFRLSPDFRPHDFEAISDAEVTEVTEVTEVIKWQAIRPCYSFRAVILSREKKLTQIGCVVTELLPRWLCQWRPLELVEAGKTCFWGLLTALRFRPHVFRLIVRGTCEDVRLHKTNSHKALWHFFGFFPKNTINT